MPLVLVGSRFWSGLIDWMRNTLVSEGMIAATDLDMMTIVDSSDAVVNAIFDFMTRADFRKRRASANRCFIYRICLREVACAGLRGWR